MQTHLADFIKNTPEGHLAESILRKCVHCGFCNATCPTYQIQGDELDGPRGRIYLIKQALEGQPVGAKTQLHLDRCLTCRNCESTCPSGVEYGHLLDIGRQVITQRSQRPWRQKIMRMLLAYGLPSRLFGIALYVGQSLRFLMPPTLKQRVPPRQTKSVRPIPRHQRRMLLLEGCVQPSLQPNINDSAVRILDALGISLISVPQTRCCGALRLHLDYQEQAKQDMRNNIDAWWSMIETGEIEAIITTASGCGVMVQEYGHYLAEDKKYAQRAERISQLARDIGEVVASEQNQLLALMQEKKSPLADSELRIAYHPPCTLQHGQKKPGQVEKLLRALGYHLLPVPEDHLCCGSAGTYSILQPHLSRQLKERKIKNLCSSQPDMILSSNIGCLLHLQTATQVPVRHWIEVLDRQLQTQTTPNVV